ncbi:hypothetical protein BN11_3560003 [Nostocoides australiense Ben110]|uniref:Uncharacterized protein n=1 Tax=Nostocoides australiense Ben110 TaxID=1193182 RepID=W6JXW6_9MICO|nr:hypothetical protein BN11_3560003 [Tetrasphaera australiensis Ben110]
MAGAAYPRGLFPSEERPLAAGPWRDRLGLRAAAATADHQAQCKGAQIAYRHDRALG